MMSTNLRTVDAIVSDEDLAAFAPPGILQRMDLLRAFFPFVDAKYFDSHTCVWDEDYDYGICALLNTSMVTLLQREGYQCRLFGASEFRMQEVPKWGNHGGHDWLLVGDRYVVDLWLPVYTHPEERQMVWDMEVAPNPYLPERHLWTQVPLTTSYFHNWLEMATQDWLDHLQKFNSQHNE